MYSKSFFFKSLPPFSIIGNTYIVAYRLFLNNNKNVPNNTIELFGNLYFDDPLDNTKCKIIIFNYLPTYFV